MQVCTLQLWPTDTLVFEQLTYKVFVYDIG